MQGGPKGSLSYIKRQLLHLQDGTGWLYIIAGWIAAE